MNHVPCNNLNLIVQFILCLPGTNAATERVFSLVNDLWTEKKSQIKVETLKDLLQVKCTCKCHVENFMK